MPVNPEGHDHEVHGSYLPPSPKEGQSKKKEGPETWTQKAAKKLLEMQTFKIEDVDPVEADELLAKTEKHLNKIGLTLDELRRMIAFKRPTLEEMKRANVYMDADILPEESLRDIKRAEKRKLVAEIKNFQREIGTNPDGIFGPKSMLALIEQAKTDPFISVDMDSILNSKNIASDTLAANLKKQLAATRSKKETSPLSHEELMGTLSEDERLMLGQVASKITGKQEQQINYTDREGNNQIVRIINNPNNPYIGIDDFRFAEPYFSKYSRDVLAEFGYREGGDIGQVAAK